MIQVVGEVYLLEIHQLYIAKLDDFTGNPTSNRITRNPTVLGVIFACAKLAENRRRYFITFHTHITIPH